MRVWGVSPQAWSEVGFGPTFRGRTETLGRAAEWPPLRGFCRQGLTYNSLAAAVPTTTARMVNNTAKVAKNKMLMLQQSLLRRSPTQFWGLP